MNIQSNLTELHSIVSVKKTRGTLGIINFNKSMIHGSISYVAKGSTIYKVRTATLIDEQVFVASKPHGPMLQQINLTAVNI